ncbi:MAG: TolC family protein [Myxococcales bacterium]|nr:TolC family protein [Myxococcales bacterium]
MVATLLLLGLLADPFGAPTLSVEAAVQHALVASPRLKAARLRLQAARRAAEGAAPWPEPVVQATASPLPIVTRNGPAIASLGVTQAFPWYAAIDGERDAARLGGDERAAEVALAELALARAVRQACHRLRQSTDELAVVQRMALIARRLFHLAEARLSVDQANQADVLLVQAELARLENEALDLTWQRRTREAELNTLLARPLDAPLPVVEPLAADPAPAVDGLLAWARDHHPELARLDARIEATRARLRVAEVRGWPRLTAGATWTFLQPGQAMGDDAGQDALMLMAGVSVPLWQDRYGASAEAVEAEAAAAEAARAAAVDVAVLEVLAAHVQVETAMRQVRLLDEALLPLSRQALETLESRYGAGGIGFSTVLEAERALERFERQRVAAAAEVGTRVADLRYAVGRPVEGAP